MAIAKHDHQEQYDIRSSLHGVLSSKSQNLGVGVIADSQPGITETIEVWTNRRDQPLVLGSDQHAACSGHMESQP